MACPRPCLAALAPTARRQPARTKPGGRHMIRRRFLTACRERVTGMGYSLRFWARPIAATIFKCPIEKQWQCGFAMNDGTGSPAGQRESFVTQASDRLIVWDHRRTPGCSDSRIAAPPRPPYLPFVGGSASNTHYPPRHNGRMNGLFYDAHAQALKPTDLRVRNFREPGSLPAIADYPGE